MIVQFGRVFRESVRWAFLLAVSALVATACSAIPGLTSGGTTISGRVSGPSVGSKTKIAVMFGVAGPDVFDQAVIIPVAADGTFSYMVGPDKDTVTLVPFQDTNGDGKLESGKPNSFEPNTCSDCSYVQATKTGDRWSVSIVHNGASTVVDASAANLTISG